MGIDLRDRCVSTHERRVELSAVEYRLFLPAGRRAHSRVETSTSNYLGPKERKGVLRFSGSGLGW